jgi:alkylhydroperoxidase family enzyme
MPRPTQNSASDRAPAPAPGELDSDAASLLERLPQGEDGPLHLMAVLISNPVLLRSWARFTGKLFSGLLSDRERELSILRTAANLKSSYEWGNHAELGLAAGLTGAEIEALGRDDPGEAWNPGELTLIRAADELCRDGELQRETWDELYAERGAPAAIEVVFLVGAYRIVRGLVGSLGVKDEPGKPTLGSATAET